MKYIDKDGSLRSAKLMLDFHEELDKAFLEKEIWEYIPELLPVSYCEKGANAATIRLKWQGSVYKNLLINVDIVPALYFPYFWPPNVSETLLINELVKKKGVHVVTAVHNDLFLENREKHFRLSFSLTETEIFQALPNLSSRRTVIYMQRRFYLHIY